MYNQTNMPGLTLRPVGNSLIVSPLPFVKWTSQKSPKSAEVVGLSYSSPQTNMPGLTLRPVGNSLIVSPLPFVKWTSQKSSKSAEVVGLSYSSPQTKTAWHCPICFLGGGGVFVFFFGGGGGCSYEFNNLPTVTVHVLYLHFREQSFGDYGKVLCIWQQ